MRIQGLQPRMQHPHRGMQPDRIQPHTAWLYPSLQRSGKGPHAGQANPFDSPPPPPSHLLRARLQIPIDAVLQQHLERHLCVTKQLRDAADGVFSRPWASQPPLLLHPRALEGAPGPLWMLMWGARLSPRLV
jgi:hypothetical protein